MKNIIWIVLVSVCLTGCESKRNDTNRKNKINITAHRVIIENENLNLNFQCGYSSYSLFDDSTIIHYLYNQSEVLIINTESGKSRKLTFSASDQNKLALWNANVYNVNGHLYLCTEKSELFDISDGEPRLLTIINKSRFMKENGLVMNPTQGFTREFCFINEDEFIFSTLLTKESNHEGVAGYPLFCKFNLKSKKITPYKYFYRDTYFKLKRPLRTNVYSTVVGDTLIVAYMFSDRVDLFSLKKNRSIGSKFLNSKSYSGDIPYLDKHYTDFEMERFDIESAAYGPVIYNPMKTCYYRIFYKELPEKNSLDEYTIQRDKKAAIVIYDKNMDWIGEIDIDNNFVSGITPTKAGFILNLNEVKFANNKILFKEYKHDN